MCTNVQVVIVCSGLSKELYQRKRNTLKRFEEVLGIMDLIREVFTEIPVVRLVENVQALDWSGPESRIAISRDFFEKCTYLPVEVRQDLPSAQDIIGVIGIWLNMIFTRWLEILRTGME